MAQARLLAADSFDLRLQGSGGDEAAFVPLDALGDIEVGVWECQAGESRDLEADEVLLILKGEGEIEFADGSVIRLVPGVVVRLHAGDRTVWRVTSPIRKFYVG